MRQQNPEAVKTIADRLRKKGGLLECVNGFDEDGHTLLHWAAKVCKCIRIDTLLHRFCYYYTSPPLFGMVGSHYHLIVSTIALIFFKSFLSHQGGAIDIVNTLVECGAEIEAPSKDAVGMYPIHWACTEGHLRIIIWVC